MGVALVSDLSDLSDLSDNFGAPLYTPWVCVSLAGLARVMICRRGVLARWQRWFAGGGGVALVSDLSDLSDLSDKFGAPLYTPWVCRALFGMAQGGRFTVGVCWLF